MDINADRPPWLEAAEQFSRPILTVEVRFEAPRDRVVVLGDVDCDLFSVFVAKPGAETDGIIRVVRSEAKATHPALSAT